MNKTKITIDDIKRLNESYQAPDRYFDSLADRINARKNEQLPFIRIEDVRPLDESFQVPEGYFEGFMEKIEERKESESNVVSFRQKRIRIWGSFVAVACIAMIIVSVINLGPKEITTSPPVADNHSHRLNNISDKEMATLLDERDDEFELTEEEIIDIIDHKAVQSESTAIIEYLQDNNLGGVNENEDFLDEI